MQTEEEKQSVMWELVDGDLAKVNGRTAFDAMRKGDACGAAVVDQFVEHLGCGLTNMINLFQPDKICIGGGIGHEGETLLKPLREYVRKYEYQHYGKKTEICQAVLGNDAGIIGAALLALATITLFPSLSTWLPGRLGLN